MNISILVKFTTISLASLLATFLCFCLMYTLITFEIQRIPEIKLIRISSPVISPTREKERPEIRDTALKLLPSEPPPTPESNTSFPDITLAASSQFKNQHKFGEYFRAEVPPFTPRRPARDLFPIVVVQPTYPFAAMMKEIEGHVLISFSVRANGTVSNAYVLDAKPKHTFDDAALSAIRKFKFQPRSIGGDVIPAENIKLKFAFVMDSPYATLLSD